MTPTFLTVASGKLVSSLFQLSRAVPIALFSGSHQVTGVYLAFTNDPTDPGSGPSSNFGRAVRTDGTGSAYTVILGGRPVWGTLVYPATTWGRIEVDSNIVVRSFSIVELAGR